MIGYVYPISGTNSWTGVFNSVQQGGDITDLTSTMSDSNTVDLAFAAVLEVYNLTYCSQYPSSGTDTFGSIGLYVNGVFQSPSWTLSTPSEIPSCSMALSQSGKSVTMSWSTSP